MNLRLNLQSSCSSWLATRWVSLALPLAFSAVIGLSGPARADVVVWQTGPFCDGCTLTNITFVSVEQFDAYTNAILLRVDVAYNQVSSITDIVQSVRARIYLADTNLVAAQQIVANEGIVSADDYIVAARSQLGTYGPSRLSALRRLDDVDAQVVESTLAINDVKLAVLSGADETRAQVATSCATGGVCCCQCPDYTSYLESILSRLSSIDLYTEFLAQKIGEVIDSYLITDEGGLLDAAYWSLYGLQSAFDMYDNLDVGYYLGEYGGLLLTNRYVLATQLERVFASKNPFQRTLDFASDPLAYLLADVGTFWQQLLYDGPANPGGYVSGPVAGWRDFALTKNNHPTNTADNALWVRFGDSDSTYVSVSVDDIGDDFYRALSNLLTRLEIQVNNSLSQPSLHVTIDNTNELSLVDSPGRLYENVVNNSTTINNIASDVQGQQAEYDEPYWTLDDYGTLFDLRDDVANWDFVGKWAQMFDDVTIEPPGPCKLWDGYAPNSGNDSGTPGPWGGWSQIIDIQSLYWYPMESCGGLIRSIRGVFRALWTIVILIVISGLVRINWLLARCGVRILIAVVSAFGSPDPMGAVVEVFETVLKALSQLYTGLFGGRPAESD